MGSLCRGGAASCKTLSGLKANLYELWAWDGEMGVSWHSILYLICINNIFNIYAIQNKMRLGTD